MIDYTVPYIHAGGVYGYVVDIMDRYDIKAADIARALDKNPRTVDKWFEKPTLAAKRFSEIFRAFDIILTKRGIDSAAALGLVPPISSHGYAVADAMRKSLFYICRTLDPLELQTLESVAWSMYQQEHPYPAFYEHGADIIATDGDKDDNGNVTTSKVIPAWCGDDVLYRRDEKREAAEQAHAEAEALANETIETIPADPSGGRWDVYEQIQDAQQRERKAAAWRQWADSRPTDMPMTPEFRQLLAILELEAPRDDQSGDALMDPELKRLSAILQSEMLKADQTPDDAQEGAEPTQ